MDEWGSISRRVSDVSLCHRFQTGSETYPASCPMGILGSFPWSKVAEA